MTYVQEKFAVSAEYAGLGEWESTGIAYEDYGRMTTQIHKQSGERRLPTPRWAINEDMLRHVLVAFMERRAMMWKTGSNFPKGTLEERLKIAQGALKKLRPIRLATLQKLCKAYPEIAKSGDKKAMKQADIEIEALDTFIRYTSGHDCGAGIILRIVQLYYGAGLDSVGVAQEVKLKPPHIRQTMWRLFQSAAILAPYDKRFAESLKELRKVERSQKIPSESLPGVACSYSYRQQPCEIVENNGKLVKIRNGKSEVLTVEAKAIEIEYEITAPAQAA